MHGGRAERHNRAGKVDGQWAGQTNIVRDSRTTAVPSVVMNVTLLDRLQVHYVIIASLLLQLVLHLEVQRRAWAAVGCDVYDGEGVLTNA